ncbi:acetaldehyde dehydrogenase [Pectobacterium atrosepticum SCRI1043]|uniref:Acetaldehyde dehydrogenase n=1 Tax=Pectobacterium atrosepticum (strain SCRI 1043 / ATCC BAA-672) TaxID=218491 RepID=ACDH_PECAS|nr:acetaldehyde dehydrogenase (acetylating) [Pectobacterium atrosepticum]Q6D797.1 RecName: Full=Acetaldehyde dehydrogenase; AltName: Full=Acetaldehyde dehydrogenase [acetylating] [Pectobacterium atrosepticum SCRI1043]MCL6317507.1 acetaldehyde dehydrogenase (acetylating) [Pectobacterium atrosepticum]MCL6321687.1 acetaldehyde dehydrogenase (acetylating) [Pectobacterium atrosepticum]CAG74338.1 acetaldehyde dehydrogenase [Pectobacterium atrosepticum SCRI1043]
MTNLNKKVRVGIIGSGNIGTDLLIKTMRSESLTCTIFAGRNFNSAGMKRANELGVHISDRGIQAILDDPSICDVVFDATSAQAHIEHWRELEPLDKTVIDMTPAKVGGFCIPAINAEEILASGNRNINMVTCGGQSSIPIANAISSVHPEFEYIEVASSIASRSAGPATRANLDEYIDTTEKALKQFTGAQRTKAILILNPAVPPIDMQTTIYAKIDRPNIAAIDAAVREMVERLKRYVPGYQLVLPPTLDGNRVVTTVKVMGNGDYLPQYAGNLDIINCAAIAVTEMISSLRYGK